MKVKIGKVEIDAVDDATLDDAEMCDRTLARPFNGGESPADRYTEIVKVLAPDCDAEAVRREFARCWSMRSIWRAKKDPAGLAPGFAKANALLRPLYLATGVAWEDESPGEAPRP